MWHRIWREWDWTVVICTLLLISVGVVIIGSATHVNRDGLDINDLVSKQLMFFVINTVVIVMMQWFDYRRLRSWGRPLFFITILLLVAVMLIGTSALGAQRWIQIGPITIQPSEFTKLLMIISMAQMNVSPRNSVLTAHFRHGATGSIYFYLLTAVDATQYIIIHFFKTGAS